jgi:two-component system phosphate regulon response regulator PhoB
MERDRILAIEDDDGVCRLLRHSLAREDFNLQIVTNGTAGLEIAQTFCPDLILLDLGLPDIDGLEVCRRLKSDPKTRHLPIIILTGNDQESDVVNGLEIGADDYIIKPVRPRILTARVRAVLRRRIEPSDTHETSQDLQIGRLTICAQRETVTLAEKTINLNSSEFHFIHALTRIILNPDNDSALNISVGQEGMALYAENRFDRMLPVFRELLAGPYQHPLLFKFCGLALIHIDPKQAETLLDQAVNIFEQTGNAVAQISVMAHLVLFHVFIDGNVEKAAELFQKTEQLENPHFDRLSVFSRISVAQALAIGNTLLRNNFSRAYEYLSIAEALAEDRGLENFRVINLLIQAYNAYVAADSTKLSRIIDETLLLLNHPQINTTNRALLKMAQMIYISLTGEYTYFRSIEKSLRAEFDDCLPSTSFPPCLLTILQAQSAQTKGDHDTVLALQTSSINSRLQQPVLTGISALSAALTGQSVVVRKSISAFLESTQSVPFFDIQGRLYCVRALLEIGLVAEAASLLEQIDIRLESTNWQFIEIQALALSLLFHRDRTMTPQRLTALQKLLSEMKATGVRHPLCLTSNDLQFLLETAVSHNIERLFAAGLCNEMFKTGWDHEWKPVPLLHFKTLGGFQLFCQNRQLTSTNKFSRSQRDCLALLIAAPNNRVDQEEMQLTFWPDSPPEKARANLDTMLSRLRKTLQALIKPLAIKNYLKLQKGVISLDYCSFDIDELRYELDRGQKFLSNRDLWLADIAISRGLLLWDGDFIPGSCVVNQTTEIANQLHHTCISMTRLFGDTLTGLGQSTRAIKLLNKALSFDRCNEELIAALHRNYMRSNLLTKADHLLRQYEDALQQEGYSPAEICRLLTRLRALIAK